jgi:hypothetical protein
MTPRAFAAVGLRLLGAWLILESILSLLYSLFGPLGRPLAPLPLGAHRQYFNGGAAIDLNLHDTYYIITHFTPFFFGIVPAFVVGCILLICSKPFSRLLARNLEDID